MYGCSAANTAIFGCGERTGNPPLEALVVEHAQLKGMTKGVNYSAITELAEYARKELAFEIPRNYPLVGKDFNVTRAGIHADGLLKNEEIYSVFDTERLLNRPLGVMITDKSGVAGVKHWIEQRFEVEPLKKSDHRLQSIYELIKVEYEQGRTTSISDDEMAGWVAEKFGKLPVKK